MKASELFNQVTADLVAAIEAGASNWRMPWQRLASIGMPRSADGRSYRGWNALVLAMAAAERGWPSSTWATYRAWQRHGGQVRRGERGTHVVLWKPMERASEGGDTDKPDESRRSLFARTFTVFAAEQVESVEQLHARVASADDAARLVDAEAYFEGVAAHVEFGGSVACYVPALDAIRLPTLEQFERLADFYSTSAHEHVHWTGHRSRLGRDLSGRFGDRPYGAEELIAELGAAFWCAQFRLEQATRTDHAAYLGDWLAMLKQDARALVAVCGRAQRAVDYLNTAAGWTSTALALAPTAEP